MHNSHFPFVHSTFPPYGFHFYSGLHTHTHIIFAFKLDVKKKEELNKS